MLRKKLYFGSNFMETTAPKVSFHTLGCRLNLSETGSIADGFKSRGYSIVPFEKNADVVFLNTCTVTDGADSTCRNMIRKARKFSPEAKIVVAGCYAQMEAEKIKKMDGVDLILGTTEKYKVFDYLDLEEKNIVKIDQTNDFWGAATTLADSHTRAFLKIQDGCNYVCSFCIIPFARGRSRTISVDEAVKEAKRLTGDGFKEIVLTGVNIGEYERSSGEKLSDMVKAISELEDLKRLRLSSVEPNTITKELLETLKETGKYMDHFHVPLQSGSDRVLRSMRRKYDTNFYRDIMDMIHDYFPGAAIGADMIAGYPGETEEEFLETYDFVKEMPITHFHVFPFSTRKGTTAAKLENQIQGPIKKERVKKLLALGELKLANYALDHKGSEFEVLFEQEKNGRFFGYTENYLKFSVDSEIDLSNQIHKVKTISAVGTELFGELI